MRISKLAHNYILQHIKDLFIKNKNCCGQFSFQLVCCGPNEFKWKFFNDSVNLTKQLENKHIAGLNYLRSEYADSFLVNKKLIVGCCDKVKILELVDAVVPALRITFGGTNVGFIFGGNVPTDIVIDWGDGVIDSLPAFTATFLTHTYSSGPNTAIITATDFSLVEQLSADFNSFPYFYDNQISAVEGINLLTGLKTLALGNQQLTGTLDLSSISSIIESIDLKYNVLTDVILPTILPSTLNILWLHYNQLTNFNPATILPASLTQFFLSGNQLTSFNITAGLPSNLYLLYLDNNNITSFTLAAPASLGYLLLSNNELTTFDPTLLALTTQPHLLVDGNKLPVSVINNILVVENARGLTSGEYTMNNQIPLAAPSGAGITAKTALQGRANLVQTD